MSQIAFAHLHSHTEFSLLDGSNRIRDYLDRVKELGMSSAAITDHGVMYGVVDFYKYAKSIGIHPVLGCEVYVAPGDMTQKGESRDRYFHLVLLAENNTGYQNLIKLVSIGFTKGFYYRPRIDLKTLKTHHEGIIALSACLAGELPKMLLKGQYNAACRLAKTYHDIFGDGNYYLELQDHGIPEQKTLNSLLIRMGHELSIPLVATNDVHYTRAEDAVSHDVLLCIQTKAKVAAKDRLRYDGGQYYVKSPAEMLSLFPEVPEALENTEKIAKRCQVELIFNHYHLPRYDTPEGTNSWEYLNRLCMEGLKRLYPDTWGSRQEKLSYELSVIQKMGFVDYFLITWDFIHYAKEHGIPVGPGRGSAAGSLVSYCLGITEIDPTKYNLLFERFLNPERVTMPDIDVDFCYERRGEVINYVIEKYGKENVAQIVTFGTLAAKGVIRDVGHALGVAPAVIAQVTKLIPPDANTTITSALENMEELKKWYENDAEIKNLLDTAKKLEGLPRHTSTHAAGVVICPRPVTEFVPVCQSSDGGIQTQYIMTTLEELGLLKMDFLGLRTLTVIKKAQREASENSQKEVLIDYSDPAVFQYIGTGQTDGIFQLESEGMKQFMKQLKPKCLEDLIAGISLYRPGPMDFIPQYIAGKECPEKIAYEIPQLEEILSPTYGCIVYQEQVMQIVRKLAGYSFGRADLVRRAMSKKKTAVMEKERQYFLYGNEETGLPGCIKNGIDSEAANKVFDGMIDFAKYAFNKSHAATYAVVAYQTAYLKYYYPAEFLAALMSSVRDDSGKVAGYLLLSRQMSIEIEKPDIRRGGVEFATERGTIIYSLAAIRKVGEGVVEAIVAERTKNEFRDFKDFLTRMSARSGFDKSTVEALIKAGALDCFGHTRKHLIKEYPDILNQIQNNRKNGMLGQSPLFSLFDNSSHAPGHEEEYPKAVILADEKEVLGIYLSGHPLEEHYSEWISRITAKSTDFIFQENGICQLPDGGRVTVGGLVSKIVEKQTRKKTAMAYVTLEDLVGTVEIVVFPEAYSRYRDRLSEGTALFCTGKVQAEDEKDAKLVLDKCEVFSGTACGKSAQIWLQFKDKDGYEKVIPALDRLFSSYPGTGCVIIYLRDTAQMKKITTKGLDACETVVNQLNLLLGAKNVCIK